MRTQLQLIFSLSEKEMEEHTPHPCHHPMHLFPFQ